MLLSEQAELYIESTEVAVILNTRPDLIAFSSVPPQIWEIKPTAERSQGFVQVLQYIIAANLALLAEAKVTGNPLGSLFSFGTGLPPKMGYQPPIVTFAGQQVPIDQNTPGVIVYDNTEALKVDLEIAEATAAFSVVIGAVAIIDPLIAPLLIAIQEAIDSAIDIAYAGLTTAVATAAAAVGPLLAFGSQLSPAFQHLNAAPGAGPDPTIATAAVADLDPNDPRLPRLLAEAEQNWSAAIGGLPPLSFGIIVEPLPAGLLGESAVTAWDSSGRPLAGMIYLSPNAAGQGWYVGSATDDSVAFQQSPGSTISYAAPGSAAFGHDDLLTTLEHEVGHILAFSPANPGYNSHLQTINGTEVFVGADFTLPVAPGGELDPTLYPDDVMAATLAPGVRKLPEENEMEVVSTLWGNHLPPPLPPYDDSDPTAAVQTSATTGIAGYPCCGCLHNIGAGSGHRGTRSECHDE